jgi:hypothetical protein
MPGGFGNKASFYFKKTKESKKYPSNFISQSYTELKE